MTDDRDALTAAELQRRFGQAAPAEASLGLRAAVAAIPTAIEREWTPTWRRFALPAIAGAAAAVLVVLISQGMGLLPPGLGAGGAPAPTTVFDPMIVGPGVAAPANSNFHIAVVVILSAVLFVWAIGSTGWRRLAGYVAAAVPVAWALFGTFVPLDVGITGWGPGISVVAAAMPPGADEDLYYEVAQPYQPFSFGVLLIGGDPLPVRVESVVTDVPLDQDFVGVRWAAVWLDGEPNGGMAGPAQPFTPFVLDRSVQAIWIVGRASGCSLGHVPTAQGGTSQTWPGDVRLNVSVLGWPRMVDVQGNHQLRLVEPGPDSCAPPPRPLLTNQP